MQGLRRSRFIVLWVSAGMLVIGNVGTTYAQSDVAITIPTVSEAVAPVQAIGPVAKDGHRGHGYLRRPPGSGRFPAVLLLHPGNVELRAAILKEYVSTAAMPSRFLSAGYVLAATTYRSRDIDPQSRDAAEDSLAAVDYLRKLEYVDRQSIVVYGCSNGGDLALEIAAATDVAAIAAEEPATQMFTGVFNRDTPKAGERFTPLDSRPISADPMRFYTSEYERFTRAKVRTIRAPILMLHGDGGRYNAEVLIPELRQAGKSVELKTYSGEPHCFAAGPIGDLPIKTPRPTVALQAFQDADSFFRRYLKTEPKAIAPSLVKQVPVHAR